MRKLFLDLDGLGADWAKYVVNRMPTIDSIEQLNSMDVEPRNELLRQFYEQNPRTFYCLPVIKKYKQLIDFANQNFDEWYVLTAGAPQHLQPNVVKRDKRLWLADVFELPTTKSIVVRDSVDKLRYAKGGHILVDDFKKTCTAWNAAGGVSIHVRTKTYDPGQVIAKIKKVM